MSGSASAKKGKALEKAVKGIESVVLKSQPELADRSLTIRANHRFNDRGVNHEIDLLIAVDDGTAQQELHAYECKNRALPTDKDQVIVFSHKLKVLGAASGTIVAKKFTSGARAQAAQDKKIKLLTFTQDFWTVVDQLQWVATSYDVGTAKTTVQYYQPWPENLTLSTESACLLRGRKMSLVELAGAITDAEFAKIRQRNELAALEGLHKRQAVVQRSFGRGDFAIAGYDVAMIVLEI